MDNICSSAVYKKTIDSCHGRVRVISTKSKGRAIVATQPIPAGTVIWVEDPFAAVATTTSSQGGDSSFVRRFSLRPHELKMLAEASRALGGTGKAFQGQSAILAARIVALELSVGADLNDARSSTIGRTSALLCRHDQFQRNDPGGLSAVVSIVQSLVACSTSQVASREQCVDILSRIACNGFTVVDEREHTTLGIGIYPTSALVNHSCDPNCVQAFETESGSGRLRLATVRPIAQNEELTISYIEASRLTWCRRRELLLGYFFNCQCSLCCREDNHDTLVCSRCAKPSTDSFTVLMALTYQRWLAGPTQLEQPTAANITTFGKFLEDWSVPHGEFWLKLVSAGLLSFDCEPTSNKRAHVHTAVGFICHGCGVTMPLSSITGTLQALYACWCKIAVASSRCSEEQMAQELEVALGVSESLVGHGSGHPTQVILLQRLTSVLLDLLISKSNSVSHDGKLSSQQKRSELLTSAKRYFQHAARLLRNMTQPGSLLTNHIQTALKTAEVSFAWTRFSFSWGDSSLSKSELLSHIDAAKKIIRSLHGNNNASYYELCQYADAIARS